MSNLPMSLAEVRKRLEQKWVNYPPPEDLLEDLATFGAMVHKANIEGLARGDCKDPCSPCTTDKVIADLARQFLSKTVMGPRRTKT